MDKQVKCQLCGQTNVRQLNFLAQNQEQIEQPLNQDNNEQLPLYLCQDCFQSQYFEKYGQYYESVIDAQNNQFNYKLIFNQIQEQQRNKIVGENEGLQQAQQRKIEREQREQIQEYISKQELQEQINELPVLQDDLNITNKDVFNVDGSTFLRTKFKSYIQNQQIKYNEETGEFLFEDENLLNKLQRQQDLQFNFFEWCEKIAKVQLLFEKYMNQQNTENLSFARYDLISDQNQLKVVLKDRGNSCICGKQINKDEQLCLKIVDTLNETKIELQMRFDKNDGNLMVCQVDKNENYEELIENLYSQQYSNMFKFTQRQDLQFAENAAQRFLGGIYRNYDIFEPCQNLETQLVIKQSDDWFKKTKKGIKNAKQMYEGKNIQNQNEMDIFSQEQINLRNQLINKLLYDKAKQNTQLQQNQFSDEEIIQMGHNFGYTPSMAQQRIIKSALNQQVTCINGIPSSGKTILGLTIAGLLAKSEKILIVVKQNKTADHICQLLSNIFDEGELIRIYSHTQQAIKNQQKDDKLYQAIEQYTLQQLIINEANKKDVEFGFDVQSILQNIQVNQIITNKDQLKDFIQEKSLQLINNAKIIVSTILTTYDNRLEQNFFDTVIIDDAHNVNIGETVVAASKAIKRLIMIGDMNQQSQNRHQGVWQTKYLNSFMDRMKKRQNLYTLQTPYKVNQQICKLLNRTLYHNQIGDVQVQNPIVVRSLIEKSCKLNRPLILVNQDSQSVYDETSKSYYNQQEINTVYRIIQHLLDHGVEQQQIAVQTNQLQHEISLKESIHAKYKDIQIFNLSTISGQQIPIVIYSSCISKQYIKDGEIKDFDQEFFIKRNNKFYLSTLISRTQQQFIFVGNSQFIKKESELLNVIQYISGNGLNVNIDEIL